jgi:hypothetical protein
VDENGDGICDLCRAGRANSWQFGHMRAGRWQSQATPAR